MRSRATAFSVLTIMLFAFLPPAFSIPEAPSAGPFVDAVTLQSPALAVRQSREAVVGGLTAMLTPTGGASSAPAVASAPAASLLVRGAGALEARRLLRRPTAGLAAAAATKVPPARPVAAAVTRHRVVSGDTLWTIARQSGASVNAIVAANGLSSPHKLRLGQILAIPSGVTKPATSGVTKPAATSAAPARTTTRARTDPATQSGTSASLSYRVQQGDTLSAIARRYGTNIGAIVAVNDLPSAHRLSIGQRLTVPVGSPLGRAAAALDTAPATSTVASARLLWPSRGLLTSRYGWRHRRHHDGIDVAAPRGSPIYAARAGRVIFSGWYYGYGRTVILSHGDGMTTVYGHASSLVVQTGQMVQRGEVIARVGCTGNCTGFHVHFEVRVNGRAVNPLRYLN
ncbi:MAG: peptidoglycan DD-metalloendopeptidase family protein [bacterium]